MTCFDSGIKFSYELLPYALKSIIYFHRHVSAYPIVRPVILGPRFLVKHFFHRSHSYRCRTVNIWELFHHLFSRSSKSIIILLFVTTQKLTFPRDRPHRLRGTRNTDAGRTYPRSSGVPWTRRCTRRARNSGCRWATTTRDCPATTTTPKRHKAPDY